MRHFLRFLLYTDPSRQTSVPLLEDIAVDKHYSFNYGDCYQLGKGRRSTLPYYVIANITRMQPVPDPDDGTRIAVLQEVFLAKEEEWEQFGDPPEWERDKD